MSDGDQLAHAVREAAGDGDILVPSQLVGLIAGLQNPVGALTDWNQSNRLFAAFSSEFGFINQARFAKIPIQPADMVRFAAVLRWLIRQLRRWRGAEDKECRTLVAVMVAAQSCDFANGLWHSLPDDIGANADLTDYLKKLVAHLAVTLDTPASTRRSEVQALAKFNEADAKGDWLGIMQGWIQLRDLPFISNTLQTQAARFLYRYARHSLAEAVANLRQTILAMQIVGALGIEERLQLAVATDNPYIQLAAAFRSVSERRNPHDRDASLTVPEQQLLSDLLLKVANDESRWQAWMEIFNKYPVRFPLLQTPLGAALAQVPEPAIGAYVKSIWLYPKNAQPDRGRRCVADCLTEFRTRATPERRKVLWISAHTHWLQWNFNAADPNQHMFWVGWCDLDYALVGYACECMSASEREDTIQAIGKELQTCDIQWHTSCTNVISTWNRLLSRLQPYARAARLPAEGEDWLTENKVCYPFDPATDKYTVLKYRIT